jgi:SAM-dependent methyltransferase
MGIPAVSLPPSTLSTPAGELPLAVWPCAQTSAQYQRAGCYLPASTAHPAKMLPELARRIVAEYSPPGGLVVDPLCGIGTTLVEAAALGRRAVGVELEGRWADLARANLAHAHAAGATGSGRVVTGDARQLPDLLGRDLAGRVALVVTSPPYGSSVHGQVDARPGQGVVKYDHAYSADRANLGQVGQQALLAALAEILVGCHELLRPGGLLVLTARPWRRREQLVDFPGQLARTAEAAGLVPFERNVALLVGLNSDRLVGRPSFFQLDRVRKARGRGLPLRIIAHEDVLVFRAGGPVGSRELKDPRREPEGLARPGSDMGPRVEGDRAGQARA